MPKLCDCGCGAPAPIAPYSNARTGWIKGEPLRFVHGHNGRKPIDSLIVPEDRGYATPCWIWQGGQSGNGYGRTKDHVVGKMRPAHHVFYERERGPIPDGLQLDHLCQVTQCCNPAHLEAVTHRENIRRKPATRLTPEIVAEIRQEQRRLLAGTTRRRTRPGERDAVAARYGLSSHYVKQIWAGKRWADG